jgi:hypothetical protein
MADTSIGKLSLQIVASPALLVSGLNAGADAVRGFAADTIKLLDKADGRLEKFASGITKPFSLLTAPVRAAEGLVKGFFSNIFDSERAGEIGQIRRLADTLGLTTEELTGFQYAASRSGASADALERGLRGMERKLGGVELAGEDATGTLDRFGLKSQELAQLPTGKVIGILADKYRELGTPAEKAAFAVAAFGKSGQELQPFLEKGSAGLAALSKEAELLGLSFSKTDALKVAAASGAMAKIQSSIEGFKRQLVIELAPIVAGLTENFMDWVKSIGGIPGLVKAIGNTVADIADSVLAMAAGLARVVEKTQGAFTKEKLAVAGGAALAGGAIAGPLGAAAGFAGGLLLGNAVDPGDVERAGKMSTSVEALRDRVREIRERPLKLSPAQEIEAEISNLQGVTNILEGLKRLVPAIGLEGGPALALVSALLRSFLPDALLEGKAERIEGLKKALQDLGKLAGVNALAGRVSGLSGQLGATAEGHALAAEKGARTFGMGDTEAQLAELKRQRLELVGSVAEGRGRLAGTGADLRGLEEELKLTRDLEATKERLKSLPEKIGEGVPIDRLIALGEQAELEKKIAELRKGADPRVRGEQLKGLEDLQKAQGNLNGLEVQMERLQKAGEQLEKLNAFKKLSDDAAALRDSLKTPEQAFDAQIDRLQEMRKAGQLSADQFELAARKAAASVAPAANQFTAGQALEAGSAEAVSVQNQLRFGQAGPQNLEDVIKEQKEIQEKQLAALKEVKEGIVNGFDRWLKGVGKPVLPKA